jgi:Caspase domain
VPFKVPNFHLPRSFIFLCLLAVSAWAAANTPPPAGRKYALAVGVTAYSDKPLYGCVNDATGMLEMLIGSFGFDRNGSSLLINGDATRDGILRAIERYVGLVNSGDLFVFYYSGHGTVFPDHASAERDETQILDMSWLRAQGVDIPDGRYDSAIVPIDAGVGGPERPWRNLILDDELYAIFSRMTAKGANVILISDSCHSGSLAKSLNVDDTPKFLDPETAIGAKLSGLPEAFGAEGGKAGPRDFQGRYLALTSSQDNQISIDSRYEGRRQGLFTCALKRVIQEAGASIGYQTAFNRLRELVNSSSQGIQSPSIDTRYYSGSLDDPIFSAPSPAPATASGSARLHLIVRGRGGEAIANSSLALFKPDLTSVPKQIGPSDTLAILRTNGAGEATSAPLNIRSGEYWVKAVCIGYVTFTGKVRLVDRGGVATLVVVLDPE